MEKKLKLQLTTGNYIALYILSIVLIFVGFVLYYSFNCKVLATYPISLIGYALYIYLASRAWIIECRQEARKYDSIKISRIKCLTERQLKRYRNRFWVITITTFVIFVFTIYGFYDLLSVLNFSLSAIVSRMDSFHIALLVIGYPAMIFFSCLALLIQFQTRANNFNQMLVGINYVLINEHNLYLEKKFHL